MYELVRVGHDNLIGEIIRLEGDSATIQGCLLLSSPTFWFLFYFLCFHGRKQLKVILFSVSLSFLAVAWFLARLKEF